MTAIRRAAAFPKDLICPICDTAFRPDAETFRNIATCIACGASIRASFHHEKWFLSFDVALDSQAEGLVPASEELKRRVRFSALTVRSTETTEDTYRSNINVARSTQIEVQPLTLGNREVGLAGGIGVGSIASAAFLLAGVPMPFLAIVVGGVLAGIGAWWTRSRASLSLDSKELRVRSDAFSEERTFAVTAVASFEVRRKKSLRCALIVRLLNGEEHELFPHLEKGSAQVIRNYLMFHLPRLEESSEQSFE